MNGDKMYKLVERIFDSNSRYKNFHNSSYTDLRFLTKHFDNTEWSFLFSYDIVLNNRTFFEIMECDPSKSRNATINTEILWNRSLDLGIIERWMCERHEKIYAHLEEIQSIAEENKPAISRAVDSHKFYMEFYGSLNENDLQNFDDYIKEFNEIKTMEKLKNGK